MPAPADPRTVAALRQQQLKQKLREAFASKAWSDCWVRVTFDSAVIDAAKHANGTGITSDTIGFTGGDTCVVRLYQLLGATYVFMSHEMCRCQDRPLMFVAGESQFVVKELLDYTTGQESTWRFHTRPCKDCDERFVWADMHICVHCGGDKCKPCFGNRCDRNGSRVCRECMDQHYCACNSCGEMWHEARMTFDEEQGGLCSWCSGVGSDGSDNSDGSDGSDDSD